MVEKPFTTTSDEADNIIAVAKETGKLLTCFQSTYLSFAREERCVDHRLNVIDRRYDSDFLTLRHLIRNNAFGEITEFENHYDIEMPPFMVRNKTVKYIPGEGMMFAAGSHSIDQAVVLFGRPASVTAFLRSMRGIESDIDDTFTIILQYDGEWKDLLVTIKTAIVSPMLDQLKTFVRGSEGSFIKVSISTFALKRNPD